MEELAKSFIDKYCVVTILESGGIVCTILNVTDGAMLVKCDKKQRIINLDYVLSIEELPPKKEKNK